PAGENGAREGDRLREGDHVLQLLGQHGLVEELEPVREAPVVDADPADAHPGERAPAASARSCASTTARAVRFRMSAAEEPRWSTWMARSIPRRIGPIASAPPSWARSL